MSTLQGSMHLDHQILTIEMSRHRSLLMPTDNLSAVGSIDLLSRLANTFCLLEDMVTSVWNSHPLLVNVCFSLTEMGHFACASRIQTTTALSC